MLLRKITCEAQGGLDVIRLGSLVPTSQQNNQLSPLLLEIHPVTGTVVDSQLRDTFANRLDISGVPSRKPFDPCLDARSRLKVAQGIQPLSEKVSLANFNHEATVAARLRLVNALRTVLRGPTNPQATPLLARKTAQAGSLDELLFAMIVLGDDRLIEKTVISQAGSMVGQNA